MAQLSLVGVIFLSALSVSLASWHTLPGVTHMSYKSFERVIPITISIYPGVGVLSRYLIQSFMLTSIYCWAINC